MSDTSRRSFIAVAGAGVAASAVSLAPAAVAATTRKAKAANEPVVAFVEDPASGVIQLMLGEREVVITDRDLVARILNAAGGA